MRVSGTTTQPRVERNQYNTSKKIKLYGLKNDYPQKILDIVASSGTGVVCVATYVKFMRGAGFTDTLLNELQVNRNKERTASLLNKCARDFRHFNGFAMLVKYNGLFEVSELYNVPFEHCRLEIDKDKKYTGRIAVHPDWTGLTGLTLKLADIKYIDRYNPSTVMAEMQKAGGPENYLGQLYYYTADGDFEYPVCPFDAVVTDMLTEESVSTVKYRNAKHNFLPSGILIRKGIKPPTLADGTIDTEDPRYQEQQSSAAEIRKLQGDENSCKIWVVDVDADEEKPEFAPFDGKNYDRQYEYTERSVQENIGRMSMIPPILRGVETSAGFGADLMLNAYDFMNSLTSEDRQRLSLAFKDVFTLWPVQFLDFSIKPLTYISSNASTGNQNTP
jgi:hypothetical protein